MKYKAKIITNLVGAISVFMLFNILLVSAHNVEENPLQKPPDILKKLILNRNSPVGKNPMEFDTHNNSKKDLNEIINRIKQNRTTSYIQITYSREYSFTYAGGGAIKELPNKKFTKLQNAILSNEWGGYVLQAPINSWETFYAPNLPGYTANPKVIPGEVFTNTMKDVQYYNIRYTPNNPVVKEKRQYKRTITYKLPNGTEAKPNTVQTVTQDVEKTISTGAIKLIDPIQKFAAVSVPVVSGYTANQSMVPAQTLDNKTPNNQVVTITYTQDKPKPTQKREYKRIIRYKSSDGEVSIPDNVQTIMQNVEKDIYGDYKVVAPIQSFSEVWSPKINGYTADIGSIGAQPLSDNTPTTINLTVTYRKQAPLPDKMAHIPIWVINTNDNKRLVTTEKVIPSNGNYNFENIVRSFIPDGYEFVRYKNASGWAKPGYDNVPVEIYVRPTAKDETRTYQRVIKYRVSGTTTSVATDTVQRVQQRVQTSPGTNTVVLKEPIQSFPEVTTPMKAGYSADRYTVASQKLTNATPLNQEVIVNYTKITAPPEQQGLIPIVVVDDDEQEKQLSGQLIQYPVGKPYEFTNSGVQKYVPENYKIDHIENAKGVLTSPGMGVAVRVHVKHEVTPRYAVYTRTIGFTAESDIKLPNPIKQSVEVIILYDKVTKEERISNELKSTFSAVDVPVIDGYVADKPQIAEEKITMKTALNQNIIVNYTKKSSLPEQQGLLPIVVVDDDENGKQLFGQLINYPVGKPYHFTNSDVQQYVPENYKIDHIENAKGVLSVVGMGKPVRVHVKHEVIPRYAVYKRTIEFKSEIGIDIELPRSIIQSEEAIIFYDKVTKEEYISNELKSTFSAIDVPVIDGYVADKTTIPEEKITIKTPVEQTITITYNRNVKLIVPTDIDFGKVAIGSEEYFGRKDQNTNTIKGSLAVSGLDNKHMYWFITVVPESDDKTSVFDINNQKIGIDDTRIVYQTGDGTKQGSQTVLLNNQNKDEVKLRMFHDSIDMTLIGKTQAYTLNWALKTVPA